MWGFVRGISVALLLAAPLSASAFGLHARSARSVTYYCPVPVAWVPAFGIGVYSPPPVLPAPAPAPCPPAVLAAPPIRYAPPVAAPPSGSPVVPDRTEPVMPKISDVSESRSPVSSYYDAYPVAPRQGERAASNPTVRVWNLSGRDLTVRVDGQTRNLGPGQKASLPVTRRFVWQIVGREPQSQGIPEGESALEIVLRR